MPKEEQINTKKDEGKKPNDDKKKDKDEKSAASGATLSESDIALFTRYGKGPYSDQIKNVEKEIQGLNQ